METTKKKLKLSPDLDIEKIEKTSILREIKNLIKNQETEIKQKLIIYNKLIKSIVFSFDFKENKFTNYALILTYLDVNPNSSVTDIYVNLRMEQSLVSQILKDLRTINLVIVIKQNRWRYYRVNIEGLKNIKQIIKIITNEK